MLKAGTAVLALITACGLAGCGTTPTERGVTGAGIGAGVGLVGGPPGVLIGAAVGGAVGATTTRDDIDIGDAPFDSRDTSDGTAPAPASSEPAEPATAEPSAPPTTTPQ